MLHNFALYKFTIDTDIDLDIPSTTLGPTNASECKPYENLTLQEQSTGTITNWLTYLLEVQIRYQRRKCSASAES